MRKVEGHLRKPNCTNLWVTCISIFKSETTEKNFLLYMHRTQLVFVLVGNNLRGYMSWETVRDSPSGFPYSGNPPTVFWVVPGRHGHTFGRQDFVSSKNFFYILNLQQINEMSY